MRIAGTTGAVRGGHRMRTTERDEQAPRRPDRLHRGWDAPTEIDQAMGARLSSVWMLDCFIYVAFTSTSTPCGSLAGECPPRM